MLTARRKTVLVLLAAGPVLPILLWWALQDGGYGADVWLPGLLVITLQTAVCAVALRGRFRVPSRPAGVALAALAAFCVWSFLSILWADAPGVALEGALRTLLYAGWFGLLCALPWTRVAAFGAVTAFVLAITAVGAFALWRATRVTEPIELFLDARLAFPLGYQNANAALWTMAAFPALLLASRPEVPWVLRPVLLAASVLLVGLAAMSVSRGWLFTLPVAVLAAFLLTPGRVRLALHAVPVAVALLVVGDDLLRPFRVGGGRRAQDVAAPVSAAVDTAGRSLVLAVLAVLLAGVAIVLLDRRIRPSQRVRRAADRTGAVLVVLALLAGAGAGIAASDGDPVGRIDRAWQDFKAFERVPAPGDDRFTALGTTRYDFWRVALDAWSGAPLQGLGQDNFAEQYLQERRSPVEEPRWTHSLELRLLAHTGLVGLLLFATFVVAAVLAALRRIREDDDARQFIVAAALLPTTVWLAHGSVDWLWEYPVLSGPAVGLLGMAAGLRRERRRPAGARRRRVVVAGGALAAVAVVVVTAACWLSVLDVEDAIGGWRADAPAAFQRLDRARTLNPLQTRSSLVEGLVAVQLDDLDRAERAFRRSADLEPRDWYARFQLGLIASARRRPDEALRHFRAAQERNPLEPVVGVAIRRATSRKPLSFSGAARLFQQRAARRFG